MILNFHNILLILIVTQSPMGSFYHPDHLGSAHWITDAHGTAIQYIHYAPYGELIANQQSTGYDERYKFTGKERDEETGYDYFGARYLWSVIGHWLSVDPLAGDYPWISPYAYAAWNPVKYVDPDGKEFINKFATTLQINKQKGLSEAKKMKLIKENESIQSHMFKREALDIKTVFEIFAHGSPNSVLDKFTEISSPTALATCLMKSSLYLSADNSNSSIFVFYACNTGQGKNSIAKLFSEVKEIYGSVIIAPTGTVSIDENGNEYVKGGNWNVICQGVVIDTISGGKGKMTQYVKEKLANLQSFLQHSRQQASNIQEK